MAREQGCSGGYAQYTVRHWEEGEGDIKWSHVGFRSNILAGGIAWWWKGALQFLGYICIKIFVIECLGLTNYLPARRKLFPSSQVCIWYIFKIGDLCIFGVLIIYTNPLEWKIVLLVLKRFLGCFRKSQHQIWFMFKKKHFFTHWFRYL